MLAKETQAQVSGAWPPGLLKVAGLSDLFESAFPRQRQLLDLRDATVRELAGQALDDYAGVLVDTAMESTSTPAMRITGDPAVVQAGDVVQWRPERSRAAVLYRRGDNANILFATERCNSYCLMCSQPPRAVEDGWRANELCELVELVDADEPLLTITGGEPTLLGDDLRRVVAHCACCLPATQVHILSNGRHLADAGYAACFAKSHPHLSWGIPLYGDHAALHDYVVQRAGAFAQTLRGLYALHAAGQAIELRVVLVKPTVERLAPLARFISRNLPFVEHVALMGIEPTGFANAHHEALWVDPADTLDTLPSAIASLEGHGLRVSLYNLPLCVLPRSLWRLARRSISDWKQDYLPACRQCGARERCGGFFTWVTPRWTSRAIGPITTEFVP